MKYLFESPATSVSLLHGGIAQLGERLNGIQEVSGSIPLISTISRGYGKVLKQTASGLFVCLQ